LAALAVSHAASRCELPYLARWFERQFNAGSFEITKSLSGAPVAMCRRCTSAMPAAFARDLLTVTQ
jgi:hypothetical protein